MLRKPFLKRFAQLFTFIAVLCLLVSCAYFNTFYIARKNYNDAERQRNRDDGIVKPNTKKLYNEAISWSSEILTKFKDSRYVDDSLYIIGMSNFHQGEFVKARIKFDELLDAFPENEYSYNAMYYKAKCLIELNQIDDAVTILLELVNSKNKDITGLAGLGLAEISLKIKDWNELLNAAQQIIDLNPGKEELVKAIYYKGEALYQLERFEECIETLEGLGDEKIETELRFNVNTRIALSKAKLGSLQEALTNLESIENKGEFTDFAPRIRLEIGNIYQLQGNEELAIDTYTKLAGDFPDSLAAKEAWYKIGTLLLKDLSKAREAKEAFDMVNKGSARTTELWFYEAQTKSTQIDSLLSKIELIERIADGKGKDTDESIDNREEKLESMDDTEKKDITAVEEKEDEIVEIVGVNNIQVDDESLPRARFSLAEEYVYSFGHADSALTQYKLIMEESPNTEFAVKSEYFLNLYELQSGGEYSEEAEKTLMMDSIEKHPESQFSQELKVYLGIIEKPPDVKAFIEAEHARISGQAPEVYIPLYQAVADNYPRTKSAYQVRFLTAYFYEHYTGDKEKAVEVYRKLSEETPTVNSEKYVNLAIEKIEFAKQEEGMLEDVKNNIAYYEMRIQEIETGLNLIDESGLELPAEKSDYSSPKPGDEYSGLRKIRARNARIRSRYYSN